MAKAAGLKASDGSVLGNVLCSTALRAFAYDIAAPLASLQINGSTKGYEKVVTIEGNDADGYFITGMLIVGGSGTSGSTFLKLGKAAAILHTHQDKIKAPGGGDPANAWNDRKPNFTVGGISSVIVTENGRLNDSVVFTKIGLGGSVVKQTQINWGGIFPSGTNVSSYKP